MSMKRVFLNKMMMISFVGFPLKEANVWWIQEIFLGNFLEFSITI
jgi:hypothetical protein